METILSPTNHTEFRILHIGGVYTVLETIEVSSHLYFEGFIRFSAVHYVYRNAPHVVRLPVLLPVKIILASFDYLVRDRFEARVGP